MEFVNNLKQNILHFKLDLCCFVARVRLGLLLFGYYNVIYSVVALIAVASDSFPPLYTLVQQKIMDGESVKSSGAVACCAELGTSVLLLIGVYRKDVTLLRYYTKLGLGMVVGSLLVYAMVLGLLDMLTTLFVSVSLIYQLYLIILVRSFIVEIKEKASAMNAYTVKLRLNDIEANNIEAKEKYTISMEPEVINKTEIIPIVKEDVSTPEISNKDNENTNVTIEQEVNNKNETKPKPIDKDVSNPETSLSNKENTAKVSTTRSPLVTHYPYKFVAIKIPKTTTILEEKEIEAPKEETVNESAKTESTKKEGTKKEDMVKEGTKKGNNEEVKDTVTKEETTDEEIIKSIIKPPKRSIFGRKKKTIERKVDVDESKQS